MTRSLTETQGHEIEALLKKHINKISIVKIKRRRGELNINKLSEEHQRYIRKWVKEDGWQFYSATILLGNSGPS